MAPFRAELFPLNNEEPVDVLFLGEISGTGSIALGEGKLHANEVCVNASPMAMYYFPDGRYIGMQFDIDGSSADIPLDNGDFLRVVWKK